MKRVFGVMFFLLVCKQDLLAQKKTTFMQITTVESVISGGGGRSRMIITKADGTSDEKEMNNIFSLVGINFNNLKENETSIVQALKSFTDLGWQLVSVTPLTLSPNATNQGIFITRYLLKKEE
ncbi:MAG: hypothetical protein ACK4GN_00840 [Runella sp.]